MHALRKSSFRVDKLQPALVQYLETRAFASHPITEAPRSFKFDDLEIVASTQLQKKPDWSKLVFGKNFADHMLDISWKESEGWSVPRIGPIRNLELHPAAKVLHYALELFEGMKAYYGVDGKIRMFRPDLNMARMLSTAHKCSLPEFEANELTRCIAQLIDADRSWVPQSPASSLYLRPTFIGTEPTLGVARSKEALLYVISGPVGPYYPTGLKPVSLMADPQFVRAWPGGAGAFKMGSNYAPTIAVQKEAERQGCQQVLWLYGDDHQVTEVGTMNVMVFWTNESGEKELVTAPLDGLILPGVTRRSLLDLAKSWGEFKVTERNFTMNDIVKAVNEKRLIEFFGCGTACVVCPVYRILYQGQEIKIPVPEEKVSLSGRFYKTLSDIQYGRIPDHPWAPDMDEILNLPVREKMAAKQR